MGCFFFKNIFRFTAVQVLISWVGRLQDKGKEIIMKAGNDGFTVPDGPRWSQEAWIQVVFVRRIDDYLTIYDYLWWWVYTSYWHILTIYDFWLTGLESDEAQSFRDENLGRSQRFGPIPGPHVGSRSPKRPKYLCQLETTQSPKSPCLVGTWGNSTRQLPWRWRQGAIPRNFQHFTSRTAITRCIYPLVI